MTMAQASMNDPRAPAAATAELQVLMAWFSPAFPIGGFAFSHGLEWAHECGAVTGRAQLESWLGDLLTHGSGRADSILLACAYRAFSDGPAAMQAIVDLGAALQPSAERHLEGTLQGKAFLGVVRAAYPDARLDALDGLDLASLTLPVAAGLAGAAHGVALQPLLTAYLSAFLANLCSAAVRLGVIGQTDGQRVIASLRQQVATTAVFALAATLEDLGVGALRADLFSLQHETQYSRLFRS
jgi:urease accessory protein